MPFGDYGVYKTRPIVQRWDSDNKVFMRANANSGATAKAYYVLTPYVGTVGANGVGIGYIATAIFATGCALTATAPAFKGYMYIGFSEQTIASGSDGWFQTGGPITSATLGTQSSSAGGYYCWASATISVFAALTQVAGVNAFGIGMGSAGATGVGNATYTSHDIYLYNQPVVGVG